MSESRVVMPSRLFTVVSEDISQNQYTRAWLVSESREKISKGITNRVFDNLPRVIDQSMLGLLGNRYLAIVEEARFTDAEKLKPNMTATKHIKSWMRGLIDRAIAELLDDEGEINRHIVELFGWGDLLDQIDKRKLISAYVGAAMAQLMQANQEYINEKLSDNNGLICNYINNNYPQWITESMSEKGLHFEGMSMPAKVVAVAGAGLAFGLFAVVAAVGFFAETANASSVDASSEYSGPKL